MQNQLEGFAETRSTPQRNVVILAMVFEGPVASQDPANNFHILARAHQRPAVRNAVPAFNYLWTRDAEAQEHPSSGQQVQCCSRHCCVGRSARGDLHDRGADVHALGFGSQPGQGRDAVGTPGLRGPDGMVSEPVGLLSKLHVVLGPRTPIPEA